MNPKKATWIGLTAILLWSAMVGLVRGVSEALGPVGGAAMIYSTGALLLRFTIGWPDLRTFPRCYLIAGGVLFAAYEVCLSLALGYAHTSRQAIEVSMVNYLWPSLTVTFAVLFNRQKASWLLLPGLALAFVGECWVQSGKSGINLHETVHNIADNPLSYSLALSAAILWATYCTVSVRWAKGHNGITFFFMLAALALWVHFALTPQPPLHLGSSAVIYLLMAGASLGLGNAAWSIGMLYGNVTVLATFSYFTPVLSAALAALILSQRLSATFWQGAFMVCIGSLLCWASTRKRTSI